LGIEKRSLETELRDVVIRGSVIQDSMSLRRRPVRGTPITECAVSGSVSSANGLRCCDLGPISSAEDLGWKALAVEGVLRALSEAATLLAFEARVRAISTNSSLSRHIGDAT
jgi:hypothetical protein